MTTQLRIRTEYSFKEAFGPLPRVISQLKQVGASSAGMVEIGGGTWGHIQWDKACRAADIQPMFGAEWACTATYDPDAEVRPLMWALARDTRALYNATTLAHSQLVRGMPSLTHEQALAAQGLVKFAGGALATEELVAHPDTYIDVNPSSALSQRRAAALARRTGRPLVITSDNYYPAHTDTKTFGYVGRQQKPTPQWILNWKDPHLRMAFPGLTDEELASAVRGAAEVAEQLQGVKLHKAPLISVSGDLRSLCEAGREARAIAGWGPTYVERLDRELALIHEKQFESYFLVVADMVRWAKQRMLVGPARGSAAGSLVCYLLGITEVDPIPYGLIFERFVDVTRADLPDIDLDFPDAQRDLVYEYLAERYGRENVARIGTIGSYKPKSALVQVCKRLGIPPFETFAVKNAMFVRSSGDSRANNCLIDTLNETVPGREFLEKYPAAAAAGDLEGHAAGTGVHAAGVCVCNEPVSNFCTVASGVMQVDKYDAEALNLLKIDALGLRTLGIIEDCGVATREQLYSLTFDDPKVFQLFNERKYAGIFQWEGRALQTVTDQLRITRFDDLEQITALARPGPLGGGAATRYIERHEGREQHSYPHASMGEYLDESYGLVLYQEQVLRMCREIGHMSWDDATLLRKAMSKSYGKEYFDKFGEKFIAGAAQEGISREDAQAIWDQINSMGSWSFNKCASGATLAKLAHTSNRFGGWVRIDELYDAYVVNPSPWIRQRKSMPWLYSVHHDGRAYPHKVKAIYKNGPKPCLRFTFEDGTEVVCTKDHKFVINSAWRPAGESKPGDGWLMAKCEPTPFRRGNHPPSVKNGRKAAEARHLKADACERCGVKHRRMELHHRDFEHGDLRPWDVEWLCPSCHKKEHYAAGRTRRSEKGMALDWKELIRVEDAGIVETYDIEMDEHHNFVINGGLVTHNSHSVSYAIVSYWTAWLKAHYPLEYAAACLRHAKDDQSVVDLLRELTREGIRYIAFDPERSAEDWSVQDGVIVGGFKNIVGVGDSKAEAFVLARAAGKYTDSQRRILEAPEVKYSALYPVHEKYSDYFTKPEEMGLRAGSRLTEIRDFPEEGEVVFIALMTEKDQRDENETIRVQRRKGRRVRGPSLFCDLAMVDDSTSTPITLRVDRWQYEPYGRLIMERAVENKEYFLIRGHKIRGYPMVKFERIKCLSNPGLFHVIRQQPQTAAA
jgi:DNA polymerase III alpha subunit